MPDTRRTILAVTSELPWPLDAGGRLRTFHLLRALADEFRVRLITAVTPGQHDHVAAVERAGIEVHPALVAGRTLAAEARRGLAAAWHREPYVLYRRHDRPEVRAALLAEVARQRPDVLYLDHLDSFQFARHVADTPMVLDLHNIYSLLVRREAADPARSWMVRRFLDREARLLEQVETTAVQRADAVFGVSEQERTHFSRLGGSLVALVPNGVDCGRYASLPTGRPSAPPNILFIGSLSWAPNAAAARFLAHEVLPAVRASIPQATLAIVGRNPTPEVRALANAPGVTVVADAPDIVVHLAGARVLAVPLDAGGGTRLKILEAFAAGLPVVSTPIGCEGIAGADGRELLIADRPGFAAAVCRVLEDAAAGEALAGRARALALARYDWQSIGLEARRTVRAICR